MTNYTSYPKLPIPNNSCIICFSNNRFSWCELHNSQRLYLLNSDYLNGAERIDVKFYSGKFYSFTKDAFVEWLTKNSKLKEDKKNKY